MMAPSLSESALSALLRPSIQWLFLFAPAAFALEEAGAPAPLVFFAAALAIVPAAHLIVEATEQIAARTGDAIGGLLNATFGNAPELIIAVVALRSGLLDMVRASIIGAVLANLLLSLGLSLFLGGLRQHDQVYNPRAARVYSSMMLLAVISLIVPSAFGRFFAAEEFLPHVRALNTSLALLLLAAYALYLLFSLRTHPDSFASEGSDEASHEEGTAWSAPRAVATLLGGSLIAAWMSEMLVGAAEDTGEALGMSQAFIGLVIVAIVGGAAEMLSAVSSARRNKLDLTLGIAFGSCIQIALFVAPVLVLASYAVAPQPLALEFGRAELGSLFLAVLIGAVTSSDGRGNWFKGAQLVLVYVIIAMMFYFAPVGTS